MKAYHLIEPVISEDARILILGSFPSVKSREGRFYYHHPQNRFWKVLAQICCESAPETIPQKKEFLRRHKIALWDVVASCEITGSSDSSIRDVEVNDPEWLLRQAGIIHIYTNGALADRLYHRYFEHKISLPVTKLPSTSPANASYSLERLFDCWRCIRQDIADDVP